MSVSNIASLCLVSFMLSLCWKQCWEYFPLIGLGCTKTMKSPRRSLVNYLRFQNESCGTATNTNHPFSLLPNVISACFYTQTIYHYFCTSFSWSHSLSRQPLGKYHWNQWSPYNLTLLLLEQTTGSSGQRGTSPPTEPGFSQGFFSPFCHRWSFSSLPLSPLACLVGDTSFPAISPTWLHRYYLNWTELDDDITEFNNEMPLTEKWAFNLVILH